MSSNTTETRRDIVIFSRTVWDEPPRMRHQLSRLLREQGHAITFFERCHHNPFRIRRRQEEDIHFIQHAELVNHQLHLTPMVARINALMAKHYIKRGLKDTKPDLILNFNYDYGFLRSMFPDLPMVTVINDDFEAQAIFRKKGSIARATAETCAVSDVVLAVSYAILDQLRPHNKNTQLFLPWAASPYTPPDPDTTRDVALYWGYINHKMDWDMVERLASRGTKLRFVGPVLSIVKPRVAQLNEHPNVEIIPPQSLEELSLDDVYCLLVPYDPDVKTVGGITVPNKCFNMLSRGIPMVACDFGRPLEAPDTVIRICRKEDDYTEALAFFKDAFHDVQSQIKGFLGDHSAGTRYEQFAGLVEEARDRRNNMP